MDIIQFRSLFERELNLEPTTEQHELLDSLCQFTFDSIDPACFILKGYAGTGKTTVLGAYIRAVAFLKRPTVLLAPTGRAAKVLSQRAGKHASTIHRRIYFTGTGADGSVRLQLAPNKLKNTIFIIDEASMIGDFSLQNDGNISRNLLEDLFQYVFQGDNCKMILLGDEGQLPPVGTEQSPALNSDYLNYHFGKVNFDLFGLLNVVRQEQDSGILHNATLLRNAQKTLTTPQLDLSSFADCREVPNDELLSQIESCYDRFGAEETMIVTRSNKRANLYNSNIRARVMYAEEEIVGGDRLMVLKNNYFWLDPSSQAGFMANGEMLHVHRIRKIETMYGVRFVTLEVSLIDYPAMDRFECLAFLETLTMETPNLPREFLKTLFFEIEKDYAHERNKQKRYQEIMKTPYFNALQVKFAYAVTCHKSQGGQWSAVFVDHGYIENEVVDLGFLRWMYTASTRATNELYFVNLMEKLRK